MGIDRHCRWVRHRLPLLSGGELGMVERRKVERHLIGCPGCRDRRVATTDAFSALRAFAEIAPVRSDASPLWPALSVQIRQSRHASPRPPWWESSWPRAWAALGLAIASIGVASAPLAWLAGREPAQAPAAAVPVAVEAPTAELPKLAAISSGALPASRSIPAGGLSSKPAPNPAFDPASTAGLQFSYDLDHGTPIPAGPGNRDPQHSY